MHDSVRSIIVMDTISSWLAPDTSNWSTFWPLRFARAGYRRAVDPHHGPIDLGAPIWSDPGASDIGDPHSPRGPIMTRFGKVAGVATATPLGRLIRSATLAAASALGVALLVAPCSAVAAPQSDASKLASGSSAPASQEPSSFITTSSTKAVTLRRGSSTTAPAIAAGCATV
jgi:hypothetical protein